MIKWLRSNWLIKIVSFLTALMLYAIVSTGNDSPAATPSVVENSDDQATVTEQLDVRYDSDKYVASGAPKSVSIRIQGSSDNVVKARLLASRSAYVDLKGMGPGTYDVKVQTSGFPSGLTVTPEPDTVRVKLEKKASKKMPVGIDILNKETVGEEFSVGDPVIDPSSVTVSGAESKLDSIAFIKGVVDVEGSDQTVVRTVSLHAYDNNGSQIDVSIDPASAHVRVPVTRVSKQLTLKAQPTGSPAEGYQVDGLELSEKEITVYTDDSNALDAITELPTLSVPVDGLKEDRTMTVDVPVPDGATRVAPESVEVTVHIARNSESASDTSDSDSGSPGGNDETITREFKDIPVKITDLSNDQEAKIDGPDRVSVTVSGPSHDIEEMTKREIEASVSLKGFNTGNNQKATVLVTVPEGTSARVNPEEVTIDITDKQANT